MPSLDTNVLIRYLVQDDPAQTRAAHRFIKRHAHTDASMFLPASVILETEWVLRSAYGYSKEAFIDVMSSLLAARELVFENEAAVEVALFYYREYKADFADCLHVASAYTHGMLPMMTFDKDAAQLDGAEALKA